MNRLMVTLMLVSLLLAGCYEQRMTTSVVTGQDTDLTVRAGYLMDGTEVGGVVKYGVADDIEWGPTNIDYAGPYIIFHLTQEATIEDLPDTSPLQPFLESLNARPYAGMELVANIEDGEHISDMRPVWVFGTSFTLTEDASTSLNVEYADGDRVRGDVSVGIQHRF